MTKGLKRGIVIFLVLEIIAMLLFYTVLDISVFLILTALVSYLTIYLLKQIKIDVTLIEDCDPEAYIEIMKNKIEKAGRRPALKAEIRLSIVNGLLELGKFEEALELVLSIDESLLKSIERANFLYTILHLECLYELGEILEAEKIYEKKIPLLSLDNAIMKDTVQLLMAKRLYFLTRYEESRERLEIMLEGKIPKITRLNILYKLAVIDEELNDFDLAKEKFKEIRSSAPKLWIAEQSKLKLAKYENY